MLPDAGHVTREDAEAGAEAETMKELEQVARKRPKGGGDRGEGEIQRIETKYFAHLSDIPLNETPYSRIKNFSDEIDLPYLVIEFSILSTYRVFLTGFSSYSNPLGWFVEFIQYRSELRVF